MATIYHLGGYGSGKTYDALRMGIYEELLKGTRGIVTNVALLQQPKVKGKTVSNKAGLGSLNELINRRFKNLDVRVLQRVRILDESEVPHFFCHRITRGGLHYDIPVPDPDAEKRGARPDFTLLRDDGIVFVLDEFHDFFNARLWAEVGRSVGWYKNQQRKLGDDIHACTPQIDEVDKQLRTIGHEYRVYNNLGLRKVRGIVMPQTFICTVYSSLDAVKRKGQPLNKYPFTLDVDLANCYDTAKGVRGLQGGSADIGKRPKGIHWSIPVAVFLIIIIGIISIAFYARHHFFKSPLSQKPLHVTSAVMSQSLISTNVPAHTATAQSLLSQQNSGVPLQSTIPAHLMFQTNRIFCTGWASTGSEYIAALSDGSIYSSADHELDYIQKRKISILGKVYEIRARPPYTDAAPLPLPDASGVATPAAPVNEIEVIPFGSRSQTSPLPANGFAHQPNPYFGFHTGNQPPLPSQNSEGQDTGQ
jgi:hypothetical protein